jgi:hypothetical protein
MLENNTLAFIASFSGGDGKWHTPSGSHSFKRWTHVAASYDRSSPANLPRLYLDGVMQTLTTVTTPAGTWTNNAQPLTIGNGLSGTRTFNGLLDEVRIYDRILTAGEIAALAAGN